MEARQLDSLWQAPSIRRRILLQQGQREWQFDSSTSLRFRIGRDPDADLSLQWPFISRTHAWLCLVRNAFVLVDVSSNGSWWQAEDGRTHFVHQQTVRLWGNGQLAFGEPLTPQSAVGFRILD